MLNNIHFIVFLLYLHIIHHKFYYIIIHIFLLSSLCIITAAILSLSYFFYPAFTIWQTDWDWSSLDPEEHSSKSNYSRSLKPGELNLKGSENSDPILKSFNFQSSQFVVLLLSQASDPNYKYQAQ